MSTHRQGTFLFAGVALVVLGLVVSVIALMTPSDSTLPNRASTAKENHEIIRLPEELSAEFQFKGGWWIANGPADDSDLQTLAKNQKTILCLSLNQAAVTAKGLDALPGHGVQVIDIIDCDIDANMAKSLSRITGLTTLLLKERSVTNEVMNAFTGPHTLKTVLFKNVKATSEGFQNLPEQFPELEYLTFLSCLNIDDSVLPTLMKCRKLESLRIIATPISAKAVTHFAKQHSLKKLAFERQRDANELIENLQDSKVQHLCISGSRIDEDMISWLSKMKQLKSLVMADCEGLTAKHLALLKKKLPSCDIFTGKKENPPELGLVE